MFYICSRPPTFLYHITQHNNNITHFLSTKPLLINKRINFSTFSAVFLNSVEDLKLKSSLMKFKKKCISTKHIILRKMSKVCKQNDLRPKVTSRYVITIIQPLHFLHVPVSFRSPLVEMFNCVYLFTSRSIVNTIGP